MSDYIKVCATCDHYPNDKHCIGCEWDKNTGDNTKWESHKVIDRKVIEDIRAEINRKANSGQWSEATVFGMQKALAIIDKHCGKE